MKSYFQSIFKIIISIINYFFTEDSNEQKRTSYEILISASVCDTIDFFVKQSRIYDKSCNDLTEQPVNEQKEQILRNAPLMPDIKKQFKIWSTNMREYDSIRTRLLNSV
jgi:hypothetical protein